MSHSVTLKDQGHSYVATVADDQDLGSPVTVVSGSYAVTFDGNDFATKHLRRIRRGSVGQLSRGDVDKVLSGYVHESVQKAQERFWGNENSTSTLIFLDLGQFCQFGCQVIKFLASNSGGWTPFGHGVNQCLQKHCVVEISKCFASSNNGFGQIKTGLTSPGKLQHGIGVTINATVKQPLGGNGRVVQVCHYAGGGVKQEFSPSSIDGGGNKMKAIGQSIVS